MEDRLLVEVKITNAEGKLTAGLTLGEMKLADVLKLEILLLDALKKIAEGQCS